MTRKSEAPSMAGAIGRDVAGCDHMPSRRCRTGCLIAIGALAATTASAEPGAWSFDATLYGWLSAIEGKVGSRGLVVDVDNSFTDTLEQSDSLLAFMLRGELRRDRLGLFLDTVYIGLGYDDVSVGPATADAKTTLFIASMGGTWELANGRAGGDATWAIDALAGGRWTRVRNEISVQAAGLSVSSRSDWVDPFVGLRVRGQLSRNWVYTVQGDIGGFGVGSDFAWQAAVSIGYRFELFGREALAMVGYRALGMDYESSSLVWDTTLHGPAIGLNIRF